MFKQFSQPTKKESKNKKMEKQIDKIKVTVTRYKHSFAPDDRIRIETKGHYYDYFYQKKDDIIKALFKAIRINETETMVDYTSDKNCNIKSKSEEV